MGSEATLYARQYQRTLSLLCQQKGSKLRNSVTIDTDFFGEYKFYNQIDATATVEKTSRHQTTPIINPDLERRRISRREFLHNFVLDENDELAMGFAPNGSYMISAVNAHGRTMDDRIIEAATGTAYTGVAGATETALTTTIANGGVGLTKSKVIEARKTLMANDVDLDNEELYLVIGEEQWEDLFDLTEVVSADYNTEKTLTTGVVGSWLGFKIITSTRLATASSIRKCLCYAKSGIQLAIAKDFKARVSERDDLNYSTQFWSNMHIGSTRMDEKKVIAIDCSEA